MAFFGNLVPCFTGSSGLDVLQKLFEGSEGGPDRLLQRRCLAILAEQLCDASQLDLESARFAVQQILDGMFWPIRKAQGQGMQLFQECLDLTFDIADSKGIFVGCYDLITPALATSAIQSLLEVIDGSNQKSEMLQLLSREFSRKVDADHPCMSQPLTAWLEWSGNGSDVSSLPFLLYSAFRTDVGQRLLELDQVNGSYKVDVLEELRRETRKQQQDVNPYAAARRAARHHLLIEAVANRVALRQSTAAQARLISEDLGAGEDPANLLFFHALVGHAGSLAAAGKALEILLQMSGGSEGSPLWAWARALAKPEKGAGGQGLHLC